MIPVSLFVLIAFKEQDLFSYYYRFSIINFVNNTIGADRKYYITSSVLLFVKTSIFYVSRNSLIQ